MAIQRFSLDSMSGACAVLSTCLLIASCGPSNSTTQGNDDSHVSAQDDVPIPPVPNQLSFAKGVTERDSASINAAIATFYALALDPAAPEVASINLLMKNSDASPAGMQNWLEARVHYVVEKSFDFEKAAEFSPTRVSYPQVDVSPIGWPDDPSSPAGAPPGEPTPALPDVHKPAPTLIMQNAGATIYALGKHLQRLIGVDLPGVGWIAMTSPRVGLLQIGPGMYLSVNGHRPQNIAENIYHAGVLFHEARHSDGHGRTLGFLHTRCPRGDYEGLTVCDQAANGPYAVGAAVEKSLAAACERSGACTELSLQLLQILYADQIDRVMPRSNASDRAADAASADWDDAPESVRKSL